MPSGHRLLTSCGIAVVSGALYALAYPPLGWWPLVFPGIAGFLIALRGHKGPNTLAIAAIWTLILTAKKQSDPNQQST